MKDYKEIFDNYMKRSKEELAALLTISEICNPITNGDNKNVFESYKDILKDIRGHREPCSDWEHCSNPHMDCVNCPLRGKTGSYKINTSGTFTTCSVGKLDEIQFTC